MLPSIMGHSHPQILPSRTGIYYADLYGTLGTGASIQAAIDAAFAAGGGKVLLSNRTYTLIAPLVLKKGVSIRGVFPSVTCSDPAGWDNNYIVSSGSVITYPGGIVFTQDTSAGNGTLSVLDGITIESIGFNNIASIITTGDTNKSGLCGSTIRDLIASNVTGVALDLTNSVLIHVSNIRGTEVYQGLRFTSDYDYNVINYQPGNSFFDDIFFYITAAGHSQPSVHIRSIDRNTRGTALNYTHFTRLQVNKFAGGASKTGNHLRLEGGNNGLSQVNGFTFNDLNLEGYADAVVYAKWTYRTKIEFMGNALPNQSNADIYLRGCALMQVNCLDSSVIFDMDDTNNNIFHYGALTNAAGGSYWPMGVYYDKTLNKIRMNIHPYGHPAYSTLISEIGNVWTMPTQQTLRFTSGGGMLERSLPWNTTPLPLDGSLMGFVQLSRAGDQSVTLIDATTCAGQRVTFKKTGASGTATLSCFGAQTIDGAATNIYLDTQWKFITLESDGANWLIVAKG